MSAEEELYELACQDMPLGGDEVRTAMNNFIFELAEEVRAMEDGVIRMAGRRVTDVDLVADFIAAKRSYDDD
ncbi:hypothetical protein [Streptomyces atratus]|uniref:hypothetical protein n=1 Tax=Streptomyces atratus TaxID=1893 RepID=UPI0036615A82